MGKAPSQGQLPPLSTKRMNNLTTFHHNFRTRGIRGDNPRRGRASRQDRDRGQAIVEFILVVPILLLLLFGMIEFGAAWRTQHVLTHASREGARYATTLPSTIDSVKHVVLQRLQEGGLNPEQALLRTQICSGSGCSGTLDVVEVDYPFNFRLLTPLLELTCLNRDCNFVGGEWRLTASTSMRNE